MSKDNLEQFIFDHRDEFDAEAPSLNIWNGIDDKLHPHKRKINFRKVAYRVSAVLVIGFFAAGFFFFGKSSQPTHLNEAPVQTMADINPEYAEIEDYYQQRINNYMGRLAALNHHDSDLYRDLKTMETMLDTLKMDWVENPHKSDEKLTNAMIANYKSRSELLERVLNKVDRGSLRTQNPYGAMPAVFNK